MMPAFLVGSINAREMRRELIMILPVPKFIEDVHDIQHQRHPNVPCQHIINTHRRHTHLLVKHSSHVIICLTQAYILLLLFY